MIQEDEKLQKIVQQLDFKPFVKRLRKVVKDGRRNGANNTSDHESGSSGCSCSWYCHAVEEAGRDGEELPDMPTILRNPHLKRTRKKRSTGK